MRNYLLLAVAFTTACTSSSAPRSTMPTSYTCGDATVVHAGSTLETKGGSVHATLGWHDDDGDHFVNWPVAPTDIDATEYVVPNDPHADAVQRVYDTSRGTSTADWRLVKREVCMARGGYTNALALFMNGATLGEVANEFGSDHDHARSLVHTALISLQKKYWRDR